MLMPPLGYRRRHGNWVLRGRGGRRGRPPRATAAGAALRWKVEKSLTGPCDFCWPLPCESESSLPRPASGPSLRCLTLKQRVAESSVL